MRIKEGDLGGDVRQVSQPDTLSPADRYQELFQAVQLQRVFADSKTFVDCTPLQEPEVILQEYRSRCSEPGFDLTAFVHERFSEPELPASNFVADPDRTLDEHIETVWTVLTRRPSQHPPRSSLLPLPEQYVVPGGRFGELYYWDSYFTMLGLHIDRRPELLASMADNFAYLIDTYGHVPNGNRTYYLSRSQPPVFSLMVELFQDRGVKKMREYLPQLRKEYSYWMDGADDLRPGESHRRCVRLADGSLLNRYWDDRDTPREEAYKEDVETAQRAGRPVHDVYRDLRAGAESGWDFSSRWQDDPKDLATIRTTAIVPIDLNCFLLKLERTIAHLAQQTGDQHLGEDFGERCHARCEAIDRHLWNRERGAYFDYDWQQEAPRLKHLTAATVVPLFVGCASQEQAGRVVEIVRQRLLAPGGLSTTEYAETGQQWDRPNGWACLQWMAIDGMSAYGYHELAHELRRRWLQIVSQLYEADAKLVEKYVLRPTTEHAKGGEYPLQDGFGWTNGVTAMLLEQDPHNQAHQCRAGRCR